MRPDLERRLQHSLSERARDVEPTPALWQEVDRRAQAHLRWRTWRLWSGSLAAAAAVLAAFAVVPMVLDAPEQPEVADGPPADTRDPLVSAAAASEQLPGHLVLVRDDELVLVDLATESEQPLPAPDGELHDVAARPGTTPGEDLEIAYTATAEREGHDRVGVIDEAGEDHVVDEFPAHGTVDPAVVFSPDGEWIAWSRAAEEAYVGLSRIAGPVGDNPAGTTMHSSVPDHPQEQRELPAGLVLNDWVHDGLPGLQLMGTHVDGHAVQLLTDLDGPTPRLTQTIPAVDGMLVRADASPSRAGPEGGYALVDHGDGLELRWTTPDDDAELPLPEDLGDGPYVLDAQQAAVTVTDEAASWLITHDGDGGDAHVADLTDATAVSILRGPEAVEDAPSGDEASDEPAEEPADADTAAPEAAGELEVDVFEALMPGSALELDGPQLRLRDAAGARTLHELEEEGARWRGVAVHPASTPGHISAVATATGVDEASLHHLEIVDGELERLEHLDDPALQPSEHWGDAAEPTPVWSPGGDALAWVEREAASMVLRVTAWDDGPVGHERIERDLPEGVEGVLVSQDWVETDAGDRSRLRLVHATGARHAVAVELEHDGQGGVAPVGAPEVLEDEGAEVRAVSTVGMIVEQEERLRWRSATTEGVERPLPEDAVPDELDQRLSLGPTSGGAAPLRSQERWWLVTADAVAPWPQEVDGVALVPAGSHGG